MAFIKHQKQTINGKEYEYWYIYESYYTPDMDNPTNFKIGKVGDSPSDLASSFKDQADKKGIDVSEDEIEDLRETVEEAQERAEDDKDIAEYIEKQEGDKQEKQSEEKSESDDSPERAEQHALVAPIKVSWSGKTREKVRSDLQHVDILDPVFESQKTNIVVKTEEQVNELLFRLHGKVKAEGEVWSTNNQKVIKRVHDEIVDELEDQGYVIENHKIQELDPESSEENSEKKDSSEKSYGGIGGGRRKKLDNIEDFERLKKLEKSDVDSKDDIQRYISEMSVPSVATARGSHVDMQDLLDRLDKMYSDLPNDEARSAYVNDTKLFRTLRSARRHFNKLVDKEKSFAQMPSAVEAGPAKYPSGKRDKKRKSLRKQKEKVEEKIDRLYGRLKGARQRALQSIGSSIGEQNEKKRANTREDQRERFEKDMMAEFFHGVTSYGRIKRVNKKSLTFEYYRNKPREEGYELDTLRIEMPSNRYTVVEYVKLTEDAVKELDEETYNLILGMDDSEVPETVDADFLEEIKQEKEEESEKEDEGEEEETVVLKKENDKGEVKEYDVPKSKAEDRADALVDAPHGEVDKIWIDGELYYGDDSSVKNEEDEDFDSKQAVKELTKEGAIVGKEASEIINRRDVDIIRNLDTTPMYISEEMVRNLRNNYEGEEIDSELDPSGFEGFDGDYQKIEVIGDVPEFMGVDGEVYGEFSEGDTVELPWENAEILINRGVAEEVEDDSGVKNEEDDTMENDKDYVEVEFLQKTPEFMGTDLENYGSFEKGDNARIPRENAEILENRGNVEVKKGASNVAEEYNQSSTDKDGQDSSFENYSDEELKEAMQEITNFIDSNGSRDSPVSYEEVYENVGFDEDFTEKAIKILLRDGRLFEPEPNHLLTI